MSTAAQSPDKLLRSPAKPDSYTTLRRQQQRAKAQGTRGKREESDAELRGTEETSVNKKERRQ